METLLKQEEKAVFSLRALYRNYGYLPFKMSKFEEYDLYVRNKDFLIGDRVITFNDLNGKLLALKPDVTLSIIKNGEDEAGCKQKVYYNENVYRVAGATHQFKEILQTGLECIGDIDAYDIYEAVYLAAKSLSLISADFVLDVSHVGILSALLDELSADTAFRAKVAHCITEKNAHDLRRICTEFGIGASDTDDLCAFIGIYGDMKTVLERLSPLCKTTHAKAAWQELHDLYLLLSESEFADRIRFDFSIINDMNYYNGIVFRGFLCGICEGVLAGGQYDKLMERMGRNAGAIGFAIYLDLLEGLGNHEADYDVDVLLLYDATTEPCTVAKVQNDLIAQGKRVSAQKAIPQKLRYREKIDLRTEVLA